MNATLIQSSRMGMPGDESLLDMMYALLLQLHDRAAALHNLGVWLVSVHVTSIATILHQ